MNSKYERSKDIVILRNHRGFSININTSVSHLIHTGWALTQDESPYKPPWSNETYKHGYESNNGMSGQGRKRREEKKDEMSEHACHMSLRTSLDRNNLPDYKKYELT